MIGYWISQGSVAAAVPPAHTKRRDMTLGAGQKPHVEIHTILFSHMGNV